MIFFNRISVLADSGLSGIEGVCNYQSNRMLTNTHKNNGKDLPMVRRKLALRGGVIPAPRLALGSLPFHCV